MTQSRTARAYGFAETKKGSEMRLENRQGGAMTITFHTGDVLECLAKLPDAKRRIAQEQGMFADMEPAE